MFEWFKRSLSRKSINLYLLISVYAISQPRILRMSRIVIRFYNLLSLCPKHVLRTGSGTLEHSTEIHDKCGDVARLVLIFPGWMAQRMHPN
jgi:hypothetical protein